MLDSRKKFTARELAERFHVSMRTIQRDLDHLQQMGFPLYAEVGANGGYRVLPNRILPPLQLTEHEAFGLFMMIEYLETYPTSPMDRFVPTWRNNISQVCPSMYKIRSFALDNTLLFFNIIRYNQNL